MRISYWSSDVCSSYREAGGRAGRVFLQDQGDLLALQPRLLEGGVLRFRERGRQAQEVADLVGGEVEGLQEAPAAEIDGHGSPRWFGEIRRDRGPAGRSCSARRRGRGRAPPRGR